MLDYFKASPAERLLLLLLDTVVLRGAGGLKERVESFSTNSKKNPR